jgi:hypothetical protein
MGLILGLVTLPLAPVRGVVWISEQIRRAADQEWSDPSTIQSALADVQDAREAGLIDDLEADRLEEELVQRLMSASQHPSGHGGGP